MPHEVEYRLLKNFDMSMISACGSGKVDCFAVGIILIGITDRVSYAREDWYI